MGVLRVWDLLALFIVLFLIILGNLLLPYRLFASFCHYLWFRGLMERPGLHRFKGKVISYFFIPFRLILRQDVKMFL